MKNDISPFAKMYRSEYFIMLKFNAVLNMSHPISAIGEFIQQGHDLVLMLIQSIITKKRKQLW